MSSQVFSENFYADLKTDSEKVWEKINRIGGTSGWYFGTILWKVRGYVDVLLGGPGYRKGRKNVEKLELGHPVDFWRVVSVNHEERWVRLRAEMRLPGEVYLDWKVESTTLHQKLEFKPKQWYGKLYWYLVKPFHSFIFYQMAKRIAMG